jgi:hypothetical protein
MTQPPTNPEDSPNAETDSDADTAGIEPTETEHPTGEDQARENAENESPA